MNTSLEKVLDSGRRVVVDLKRKYSDDGSIFSSGTKKVICPLELPFVFSDFELPKRRRLETSGGYAFPSGRQLVKYYSNFKKSGILQRLLYHQNDQWNDFSEDVVAVVNRDLVKNPAVEVEVNGSRILLDFLHMMQLDMDTGMHQPIAWIDVSGNCFFPEIFSDTEKHEFEPKHVEDYDMMGATPPGRHDVNFHLEIHLQEIDNECSGETDLIVEPVKACGNATFSSCDNEIHDNSTKGTPAQDDKKYSLNGRLEEDSNLEATSGHQPLDYAVVRDMFHKAIKADMAEINAIRECKTIFLESHFELFRKQLEITKRCRGYGNVQYAWFPCPEGTVPAILNFGIGYYNQHKVNPVNGVGLYLIPANGTKFSINDIDVDENGSRHVVLCRVIMGNMEVVHCGSEKFHPSNDNFDSGVDDLETPSCYMLWSTNMNSRIYPECVVSFNATSETEGTEFGKESRVSTPIPDNKRLPTHRTPKSPWMPFPVLFASIASRIPPHNMELVRLYYELFKSKTLSRDAFITKLRLIVGDAVLKSAITGLRREIPEPSTSVVETS